MQLTAYWWQRSRVEKCIACALGLSLLVPLLLFWDRTNWAWDVNMYVISARLLLAGAKPYVDFVDINPPLIFYVHALFLWLANLVHVAPLEFFQQLLAALAFAQIMLFSWWMAEDRFEAPVAALAPLACLVQALLTYSFGEREHLFALAFLPYLYLRWERTKHRPKLSYLEALVILTCGLCACFKPTFMAILISSELLAIFWGEFKLRRFLILMFPSVLYAAHFLFWSRDSQYAFFADLVPSVFARYRLTMGYDGSLLTFWHAPLFGYGFLALIYAVVGWSEGTLLFPIGCAALVAIGTAFVQHKGWYYHLLPAADLIYFGFPILLASVMKTQFRLVGSLSASLVFFFIVYLSESPMIGGVSRGQTDEHYQQIGQYAHACEQVFIAAASANYSYPLFYQHNYVPGSRFLFLFPLAFYNNVKERKDLIEHGRYPRFNELPLGERTFVNVLNQDLAKRLPEVMVFPVNSPFQPWHFLPDGFDPLQYFQSTGIWEKIRSYYELVYDNPELHIYRRRGSETGATTRCP